MNLKEWAASTGIAYITARRQHAAGTLPVPTYRIGRLIMVGEPVTSATAEPGQTVVYARVSSADRDVTEILTSLCARRYGRRAAANRARRAVEAATEEPA